jgi:hypothetical protein
MNEGTAMTSNLQYLRGNRQRNAPDIVLLDFVMPERNIDAIPLKRWGALARKPANQFPDYRIVSERRR